MKQTYSIPWYLRVSKFFEKILDYIVGFMIGTGTFWVWLCLGLFFLPYYVCRKAWRKAKKAYRNSFIMEVEYE